MFAWRIACQQPIFPALSTGQKWRFALATNEAVFDLRTDEKNKYSRVQ
jgi:hypothetical protein